MPQARRNYSVEILNGKLFIVGGMTISSNKDALDSFVLYNFITNEFTARQSQPRPICRMSTVTWSNTINVVGGVENNDQVLNDVIMYDTRKRRSERLPTLTLKRSGSLAVRIDDVIVVWGESNKEQKYLNSVESFTIGSDGWKELPGMEEK